MYELRSLVEHLQGKKRIGGSNVTCVMNMYAPSASLQMWICLLTIFVISVLSFALRI